MGEVVILKENCLKFLMKKNFIVCAIAFRDTSILQWFLPLYGQLKLEIILDANFSNMQLIWKFVSH